MLAADYSFARSHKKTAVHKTTKKHTASHGKKKAKYAKSSHKKNRSVASTSESSWAHTGGKKVKRNSKVGSRYTH